MKKQTVRKASILGLVLVAASAVTAAIIPAKAADKAQNERVNALVDSTEGADLTCTDLPGDQCDYTAESGTTGVGAFGTLTQDQGNYTASATTV